MPGLGKPVSKLGAPQIGLSDTEAVKCEKCGGEVFEQGLILRRVSALLTGNGKPGIVPVPVFLCSKCGHVNAEFLPEELRDGSEKLD